MTNSDGLNSNEIALFTLLTSTFFGNFEKVLIQRNPGEKNLQISNETTLRSKEGGLERLLFLTFVLGQEIKADNGLLNYWSTCEKRIDFDRVLAAVTQSLAIDFADEMDSVEDATKVRRRFRGYSKG